MELTKNIILMIIGILFVIFILYKINKSEHLTSEDITQETQKNFLNKKHSDYVSNFIKSNSIKDTSNNEIMKLLNMNFRVVNNITQLNEGINNVLLYNDNNILLLGNDGTHDSDGRTNYFIYLLTNIKVELDENGNMRVDSNGHPTGNPDSPTTFYGVAAYTGAIKTSKENPFVFNNGNLQINIDEKNNINYNSNVSGSKLMLYTDYNKDSLTDFGFAVKKPNNEIQKLVSAKDLSKDLSNKKINLFYDDSNTTKQTRNSLKTMILDNVFHTEFTNYLKTNPKI